MLESSLTPIALQLREIRNHFGIHSSYEPATRAHNHFHGRENSDVEAGHHKSRKSIFSRAHAAHHRRASAGSADKTLPDGRKSYPKVEFRRRASSIDAIKCSISPCKDPAVDRTSSEPRSKSTSAAARWRKARENVLRGVNKMPSSSDGNVGAGVQIPPPPLEAPPEQRTEQLMFRPGRRPRIEAEHRVLPREVNAVEGGVVEGEAEEDAIRSEKSLKRSDSRITPSLALGEALGSTETTDKRKSISNHMTRRGPEARGTCRLVGGTRGSLIQLAKEVRQWPVVGPILYLVSST